MTEAKISVAHEGCNSCETAREEKVSEMEGGWPYFKVQRGWLGFKTEIAQCWKIE